MQGEVFEGELAVATAKKGQKAKQLEQEGDHRTRIFSGSEPADQPLPAGLNFGEGQLAQLGKASEALSRLHEGGQILERQAAGGMVGNRGWIYHSLGRASLLLGRLDEARRMAESAVEASPSHPGFAAHALHLLGDIATHPDRFDTESAETHYREALALAEPRGMRPLVAHCHLGFGNLRRTGKQAQAQEHLATATTMYREMGMTYWLEKAEADMKQLR